LERPFFPSLIKVELGIFLADIEVEVKRITIKKPPVSRGLLCKPSNGFMN